MSSKKLPLTVLRKTRLKNNLRQKDIAYVLGCTTQYYSQLERVINVLSYDYATRLALMFNTTPDELFFEEYKKVYIKM